MRPYTGVVNFKLEGRALLDTGRRGTLRVLHLSFVYGPCASLYRRGARCQTGHSWPLPVLQIPKVKGRPRWHCGGQEVPPGKHRPGRDNTTTRRPSLTRLCFLRPSCERTGFLS